MKSKSLAGIAAILMIAGLWELCQGTWVYSKAQIAQYLLRRAWAQTLAGELNVKPWPWADTWPLARMSVPKYGVDLIILAGASGRTLAFGPGHDSGSTLPGRLGTAIVSAHRDTHFKFLRRLEAGDKLSVQVPGEEPYQFRVMEARIVDSRSTYIVDSGDLSILVLVTCYPFDAIVPGGFLRYVVISERER